MMRRSVACILLLLAPGCALPVVSANTFTPAGELKQGQLDASISLELGHVLADPRDIEVGTPNLPDGASKWQVSTWIASDLTVRYGLFPRVQVEGQLKLTNPVEPFVPEPVGGAFGVRVLLRQKALDDPRAIAIELGARFVGVRATQELTQTSGDRSQTDHWTYRALGLEVPLIASLRIHPLVALTASPFLRAYLIRAWRDTTHPDGTTVNSRLEWTPVLSGGLGLGAAFSLGRLDLSPAIAFELGTRPGVDASTQLLIEPGLSLGVRW